MQLSRRQLLALIGSFAAGGSLWALANKFDLFNESAEAHREDNSTGKVPLIYSNHYDISAFGLEKLHPFDGHKFSRIHNHIIRSGLRSSEEFFCPATITREQLLRVHSKAYLDSLGNSINLANIFELTPLAIVPPQILDWRVLKPMRIAAGGTILACRMALKHGLSINLGGGFHHADRDHGGGFCVYSDAPVAIRTLRNEGLIKKAMIIDTDAHQGNGFANVMRGDPDFFGLDLYDEGVYPFPKVEEVFSVPFPTSTGGEKYLATLEEVIPKALDRFSPELIIYNAGSDVLYDDPLATFRLTVADMNQRDLFVVKKAREARIPLAMILAGGYSKHSAEAHSKSIELICKTFDA